MFSFLKNIFHFRFHWWYLEQLLHTESLTVADLGTSGLVSRLPPNKTNAIGMLNMVLNIVLKLIQY